MREIHLIHGVDLVEVDRFRQWLETPKAGLDARFTKQERGSAGDVNEAAHLAGCFAVKEAVLKALGLGAGAGIPWTDIEVFHDKEGAPYVRLQGRAAQAHDAAGVNHLAVSVTHTGPWALASFHPETRKSM